MGPAAMRWPAPSKAPPGKGLGPTSGLLPRDHLTEESAIQVDLSKETVRLPLYQGKRRTAQTVWYVLLDASDQGIAHDLGVNYAPKLGNIAIGCPDCVQTVTLDAPTPDQNKFGQARRQLPGRARTSARPGSPSPGPAASRWRSSSPARWPARLQPVHPDRRARRPSTAPRSSPPATAPSTSSTTPTPATACSASTSPARRRPGQFAESWVDLLFVKGFDAGQPIVYISTDAGQPLTAVLERSTYVPALDKAAYNGGDDFLGSARERLFGFINGQTGADNPQAQGFVHLIKDGHASEDASAEQHGADQRAAQRRRPAQRVRRLPDPRRPAARAGLQPAVGRPARPLDRQGRQAGLNTRQIDEVQVFNLAATRPDLLTGVDPATGKPAPYGSVGVDINCAVIGFIDKAPTANLADPVANSQFPPR